jgi:hypothetical protein
MGPVALLRDGEQQSIDTPVPFVLYQNYPNLFNPTTVISFCVAMTMHLTMKVYTEDWQLVSTIIDGYRNGGLYQVTFNASNLPSGIYYYILEAAGIKKS